MAVDTQHKCVHWGHNIADIQSHGVISGSGMELLWQQNVALVVFIYSMWRVGHIYSHTYSNNYNWCNCFQDLKNNDN